MESENINGSQKIEGHGKKKCPTKEQNSLLYIAVQVSSVACCKLPQSLLQSTMLCKQFARYISILLFSMTNPGICYKVNVKMDYITLNNTANSTTIPTDDNVVKQCGYYHLEYCHPYIRNVLTLYTGIGGWILLGIVVSGISLQTYSLIRGIYNAYGPVERVLFG